MNNRQTKPYYTKSYVISMVSNIDKMMGNAHKVLNKKKKS